MNIVLIEFEYGLEGISLKGLKSNVNELIQWPSAGSERFHF